MKTFSKNTLKKYCDRLRNAEPVIAELHLKYGYPPYWKRENSFVSLCKTIIEQQVSLASAQAVFKRLQEYCIDITPAKLALLTTEEYRSNGVTRQKNRYLILLAQRLLEEPDFFQSLQKSDNEAVKQKLISLKGIGHWTAGVYMLVALNRSDIYPDYDVALINSISYEIFKNEKISNEQAKSFIEKFKPLQGIACLYFYHAYIVRRKVKFIP